MKFAGEFAGNRHRYNTNSLATVITTTEQFVNYCHRTAIAGQTYDTLELPAVARAAEDHRRQDNRSNKIAHDGIPSDREMDCQALNNLSKLFLPLYGRAADLGCAGRRNMRSLCGHWPKDKDCEADGQKEQADHRNLLWLLAGLCIRPRHLNNIDLQQFLRKSITPALDA